MTASNLNSVAAESDRVGRNPDTRLWTGLVIGLGAIVICLNASLFLVVQEQEHSLSARETDVQRRLVAVEAQEARRTNLQKEIHDLEARSTIAEKQTTESERVAADAAQQVANRDRVVRELQDAKFEASKQKVEAESLKSTIAALRADEASGRKTLAVRSEDINVLEHQRSEIETALVALKSQRNEMVSKAEAARKEANDAATLKADREAAFQDFQARRQELAKVQAELESARSARNALGVDQAAAQKALAARTEAEGALSKAQGELQAVQEQVAKTRAGLAHVEERRKNADFDEGAASRATTARVEAEKALSKAQGELSSTLSQFSTAQDQLLSVQRQRASISIDNSAAQQATSARDDAEALLAKTRESLDALRRQVTEETGRRDALLLEIDRLQNQETPSIPAMAPTKPKPSIPPARKPPSPVKN